ncbi:ribonuclease T [Sphingomonas sp. R-74633]|uniref:ribonuclease T2 family protein n=1 Tax=Sphingomonas sp. R-74633 TaxID=2751188 RepID=UPI0015D27223|nr:ribonuclease T [Sphingomonas sp. R-74633]NYT40335.1 ribonuclease T [Sphingomonas sp. R-74633]
MRKLALGLLGAGLALLPGIASAQALVCRPAGVSLRPRPDLPDASQPRRILPIGSYTLALTWNPGLCRANGGDPDNRFRCGRSARFGFTLHGLWPDGVGKTWPQYCADTRILPPAQIKQMLCTTPSAQLIQHEWAKHGTCTTMSPATFFGTAKLLYDKVRYPDMDRLSRGDLTVGQFKARFAAANPNIPAGAIRVTVTKEDWLDELWLCLDTGLRYERCKAGSGGAADGNTLKIWRGSGRR